MRRVIASIGVISALAASVLLSGASTAPASGAPACQPPTTTTTTSTSTSSTTAGSTASTTSASSSAPTTSPSAPPPTIPHPTGHPLNDNTVENCTAGTAKARSQLQAASVRGVNADPVNFAYAYAHDCSSGCQAVAVSYQVVLEDHQAQTQTPENVALAVNYRCDHCGVFAYAYQYVVGVPGGTRLSATTRRAIAMIRRDAAAAVKADLSFPVLDTKLRDLAGQLRAAVDDGLQRQHTAVTRKRSTEHLRQSGTR